MIYQNLRYTLFPYTTLFRSTFKLMEILKNFGFEPILFIAQIVNFVIIYLILKKFLYKPVLKLLKDRKQTIAGGLKQAEESARQDRKSTRLNSSHVAISYAVF